MATPIQFSRPNPERTVLGFDAEPLILTACNAFTGMGNASYFARNIHRAIDQGLNDAGLRRVMGLHGIRFFGTAVLGNFFLGAVMGATEAEKQGKSSLIIAYEGLSTGLSSGVGSGLAFAVSAGLFSYSTMGIMLPFLASVVVAGAANYLLKGASDYIFYSGLSFAYDHFDSEN